jgi:hypothetical protein
MKSLLWRTFGLTAPILLGLIGFSSPSEGIVGGGRLVQRVCGDSVTMQCNPTSSDDVCRPFTKWGDANTDNTPDDWYVADSRNLNRCDAFNKNTCSGIGDRPVEDTFCNK